MKIKALTVKAFEISDLRAYDPIRVYIENYEPGKGRITISCYDAAWVGYWGAMAGRTIEQFFIDCDAGYLSGNLSSASSLRSGEGHRAYLIRIIFAVQQALIEIEKQQKNANNSSGSFVEFSVPRGQYVGVQS